jgi:hypothetical protein
MLTQGFAIAGAAAEFLPLPVVIAGAGIAGVAVIGLLGPSLVRPVTGRS